MKIKNIQTSAFLQNLTKAYTEGVYADTPANRKLGRVGMSYAQYAQKVAGGDKSEKQNGQKENIEKESSLNKIDELPWKNNSLQVYRGNSIDYINRISKNDGTYDYRFWSLQGSYKGSLTENQVLDYYKKSIDKINTDKKENKLKYDSNKEDKDYKVPTITDLLNTQLESDSSYGFKERKLNDGGTLAEIYLADGSAIVREITKDGDTIFTIYDNEDNKHENLKEKEVNSYLKEHYTKEDALPFYNNIAKSNIYSIKDKEGNYSYIKDIKDIYKLPYKKGKMITSPGGIYITERLEMPGGGAIVKFKDKMGGISFYYVKKTGGTVDLKKNNTEKFLGIINDSIAKVNEKLNKGKMKQNPFES